MSAPLTQSRPGMSGWLDRASISGIAVQLSASNIARAVVAVSILGALLVAAQALLESEALAPWVFLAVSAGTATAIGYGVVSGRLRDAPASLAIGAAIILFATGNALQGFSPAATDSFPEPSDLIHGLGYVPLLYAAIRLVRANVRSDPAAFIDAATVGIAATLLVWHVLLEPVSTRTLSPLSTALALAYPLADLIVITLLLRLALAREVRTASVLLLLTGVGAIALAGALHAMAVMRGAPADAANDVWWLVGYVLLAAAALRIPARRSRPAPSSATWDVARLVAVSLALLVPSLLVLVDPSSLARTPGSFGLVFLVLTALVLVRLYWTVRLLARADLRFRRFMGNRDVLALIKDDRGRYTYLNERALEVSGFDRLEWYGRTDTDLYPPVSAQRFLAEDARIRADGTPIVTTERDAGRVWHAEKFLIPGSGASIGLLAVDISERVEAEDALRARERMLATAEATAHVGSWEYHAASGRSHWSAELFRICGVVPGADPDRDTIDGVLHPEDRDALWAALAAGATGTDVDLECRIVRADGIRNVHIVGAGEPCTTDDRPMVAAVQDITDRHVLDRQIRFQARLLQSVSHAVIVTDPGGRISYWNAGATRTFGWNADEILGESLETILPTDPEVRDRRWSALRNGLTFEGDWQGTRKDGTSVWIASQVTAVHDEAGRVIGFMGVSKDISGRKLAELELARLGAAMGQTSDAVIVTGADQRVAYVNPAFERLSGYSAAELLGRLPGGGGQEGEPGLAFAVALADAVALGMRWRGDIADRRKDGTEVISATTISPIVGPTGESLGWVTIERDVSAERAHEREAERHARERALIADTLRELGGRGSPEATATAVCAQVVKLPDTGLASIIVFDLDGSATVIGQVAANGGGVPGLRLPRARAKYLRERAVHGPWVERWLPDRSHPYGEVVARLGIGAHGYAPLSVGASTIGLLIAGSSAGDATAELAERLPALVEFAAITAALLATPIADRVAAAQLTATLEQIIAAGTHSTSFQPIVDLASGRVLGYEALTRFDDGVAPDVRFNDAHSVGLGIALETACLRRAFEASGALPEETWLNVNVSPQFVLDGGLDALLPDGGRRVVVEITEHEAIGDYASFRAAVGRWKGRARICIDDAGAGFASLRHIVELDPALVKLDRSLVAGIDADPVRQAIVAGMVHFSAAAGLGLVAEGIETDGELRVLRELHVPLGQGYLLGRPVSWTGVTPAGAGDDGEAARR